MEYIIAWTCICIVAYNLMRPNKSVIPHTTGEIKPHPPTPLDIALQCHPIAVQRSDDADRLVYMTDIMEGIDLL